jgi:hypothetical protein
MRCIVYFISQGKVGKLVEVKYLDISKKRQIQKKMKQEKKLHKVLKIRH